MLIVSHSGSLLSQIFVVYLNHKLFYLELIKITLNFIVFFIPSQTLYTFHQSLLLINSGF